ncbi:GrpB family protein [Clostridium sp. D2Q-14]|nr:GrpB family protein [Anaeromonas gelatinilytica]MBS4535725.1 GrpB family protein [Anaeromonas gelatinilytica]
MLGLPKGVVRLETYNPQWASEFEKEKDIIQENIGSYIIDIQHVGSTSIEGLISKPIIDIAIGVTSLYEGHKCIELLGQLGYEYKGHVGVSRRLFLQRVM